MCAAGVVRVVEVAASSALLVVAVFVVQILLVVVPNALVPTPCRFPLVHKHPYAVVVVVVVAWEKIFLALTEELGNLGQKIVASALAWKLLASWSRCCHSKERV